MATLSDFKLHPGDPAPDFALPSVDGSTVRLADIADGRLFVVAFWCNHCPYVQAWEGRMIELARRHAARGVRMVAINANDAVAFPDDRMERMIARAQEKNYPFPYLRDENQDVARAYGALVTPHPMLFGPDRKLLFQGPIDDNPDRPDRARHRYLEDAIAAGLEGRPIATPELAVTGCSVKWKS